MKNIKTVTPRALVLGAALLSVGTFFSATSSVEAAPRYNRGAGRYSRLSNFTGVVTHVHSAKNFDLNVGGKVYNVYTVSNTPFALSENDRVRVTGRPMYSNDIRRASVVILRNRRDR